SSNKCGSASDTVKVTVVNFPTTWLGNDTTLCAGRNWILDAGSGYAYQWSTGSTNQTITVSLAGTYSVTVSNACGASSDLINISYYPVNSLALGPDIHICTGNSATITATISGFTNYVWNTGATTSSIVVSTAGNYWISSSNKCGSAADTIGVFIDYAPFTSLGNDTILCVGHTLTLDAGSGYSYQWSTGDTSQTIVVSSPDVYVVVVTNACGSAFDQVNITYYPPNLLALGKDTAICPGDSVLEAITSSGFTNFIWNTGQTTTSIIVHQPGSYWVTSSNICGFGADTVNISVINLPTVNLGHDISTCVAVTLTLVATNASQYSWSTGETTISITANPPGIYWVQVSNQCGSAKDTVAVDQGTDPVFTLGKDTAMCNPYLTFNLSGVGTGYAWQDNSTQPTYTISSTGEYWVTVTNAEGCVSSDTINVSSAECPCNVDVPNAFSPNDDGINDIFWVRGYCDKFLLRIYDRWGELVFETSDVTVGWDGTFKGEKMNSGIFNYYLISYPVNADKRVKKGNVSLIR
ncbi:MAG TPA: gliding motility-associated C-terminal domain-containing protein, partial [Bacteroidia bacterium]